MLSHRPAKGRPNYSLQTACNKLAKFTSQTEYITLYHTRSQVA